MVDEITSAEQFRAHALSALEEIGKHSNAWPDNKEAYLDKIMREEIYLADRITRDSGGRGMTHAEIEAALAKKWAERKEQGPLDITNAEVADRLTQLWESERRAKSEYNNAENLLGLMRCEAAHHAADMREAALSARVAGLLGNLTLSKEEKLQLLVKLDPRSEGMNPEDLKALRDRIENIEEAATIPDNAVRNSFLARYRAEHATYSRNRSGDYVRTEPALTSQVAEGVLNELEERLKSRERTPDVQAEFNYANLSASFAGMKTNAERQAALVAAITLQAEAQAVQRWEADTGTTPNLNGAQFLEYVKREKQQIITHLREPQDPNPANPTEAVIRGMTYNDKEDRIDFDATVTQEQLQRAFNVAAYHAGDSLKRLEGSDTHDKLLKRFSERFPNTQEKRDKLRHESDDRARLEFDAILLQQEEFEREMAEQERRGATPVKPKSTVEIIMGNGSPGQKRRTRIDDNHASGEHEMTLTHHFRAPGQPLPPFNQDVFIRSGMSGTHHTVRLNNGNNRVLMTLDTAVEGVRNGRRKEYNTGGGDLVIVMTPQQAQQALLELNKGYSGEPDKKVSAITIGENGTRRTLTSQSRIVIALGETDAGGNLLFDNEGLPVIEREMPMATLISLRQASEVTQVNLETDGRHYKTTPEVSQLAANRGRLQGTTPEF